MNRFTKDMATIDDMLPLVLFDLIQVSSKHTGSKVTLPCAMFTLTPFIGLFSCRKLLRKHPK